MQFVVADMDDVTLPVVEVLKRAKELIGYDGTMTVVPAEDADFSDVTVGLGNIKGATYRTLSPKQLLTKGTSLTFLTQVMRNALDHENHKAFEFVKDENYFIVSMNDLIVGNINNSLGEGYGAPVALDIETAGNADSDPWCTGRILSIALYDGRNAYVIPDELAEHRQTAKFVQWLCENRTVICHNGSFDMGYVSQRLGITVYHDEDTLMQHFVMHNTAQEHGLKPLAQRIFGAPDWDSANKKYLKGGAHFENIPREQLYLYNAYDVYWTFQLYKLFHEQLENDPNMRRYYRFRMQVCRVLQDMQANGIKIDINVMDELGKEFVAEFEDAKGRLQQVTGNDTFNPNSPKQVKDWLDSAGHHVEKADKEALNDLAGEGGQVGEFATQLLRYRKFNKQYTTYVVGISGRVGTDGRVHPTYLPHGAKSGRLSCRNPNAQNVTRDSGVKRAFVADEGNVIIATDYSQAELRTIAELSQDEHMIAAFQPGAPDFFDNLMTQIYPEDFPTIEAYEEFDKEHHLEAKNKRALIKGVVYGSNYGRQVPAIARALKIPVEDAQSVMDAYYRTYPKLKVWQDGIREAVGRDDLLWRLTTPFGLKFRQEVVTRRTRNKVENEALSFCPQSTANDICLHAAIEVNKRLDAYGAKLVSSVHDCLYVECPIENAEAVGKMMETEMAGAAEQIFHRAPFVAEAEIGDSWQEV